MAEPEELAKCRAPLEVTSQTAVRVRLQDNVMMYACLELQQLSQRRYTKWHLGLLMLHKHVVSAAAVHGCSVSRQGKD